MMTDNDREKWDRVYATNQHGYYPPSMVLQQGSHLLPHKGTALDLACGLGRNAIFLARHGLDTWAWDISEEAIKRLDNYARQEGLLIKTGVRDVVAAPPDAGCFDVIVVSHFLDRKLIPAIVAALKSGGLLFYQTFTRLKVNDTGPNNPDYLLDRGELLQTFGDLDVLLYNDNADVGDTGTGLRNEAMIVVRKPDNR